MDFKISFKVRNHDAQLDKFKVNMGAYSKEQGDRVHEATLALKSATKVHMTAL